jgi:pimeloyl-ACP methyl ester carboxylesterase
VTMTGELVVLPGLICDGRLWRDVLAALGRADSAVTGEVTLDSSIAGMAARVLGMAPPRFALAGLSMGGYVALEIMRQAPERVTHLALFDTSARPDDEARKAKRRLGLAAVERGEFDTVAHDLVPGLMAPEHVQGVLGAEVQAMHLRVGEAVYRRQQGAIMERVDSRGGLGAISVPALVGVGALDMVTPLELAEEMADGIEGAELRVFTGCGHLPTMEAPEAVAEAMRGWLGR